MCTVNIIPSLAREARSEDFCRHTHARLGLRKGFGQFQCSFRHLQAQVCDAVLSGCSFLCYRRITQPTTQHSAPQQPIQVLHDTLLTTQQTLFLLHCSDPLSPTAVVKLLDFALRLSYRWMFSCNSTTETAASDRRK